MRYTSVFVTLAAIFSGAALLLAAAMPSTLTPAQWWWIPLGWSLWGLSIVSAVLAALGFLRGEYVRRHKGTR